MNDSFRITEKETVKTLIYEIIKVNIKDREIETTYKFERLEGKVVSENNGIKIKEYTLKTNNPNIIILTIWEDKCAVNGGIIKDGKLIISSKSKGIRYKAVKINQSAEYFKYEPSENRKILIIDLEDGKELKEEKIVYNDKEYITCKIVPNKKYLAIEFRFGISKIIVIGMCKFEKEKGKYIATIDPRESQRIDYEFFLRNIEKNMSKEIILEDRQEISKEGF